MLPGKKQYVGWMTMRRVLESTKWYRDRFAAMDVREWPHRAAELSRKLAGYRFNRDWKDIAATGNIVALPHIYDRWDSLSRELEETIAEQARRSQKGQFRLLGAEWIRPGSMPPDPTFWQRFPDGALWFGHNAYCFNAFAHAKNERREIKRIWEINRLQFLLPLALDTRRRQSAEGRDLVLNLVSSWMEGNRPYRGVNWTSGIELGLRTISVALASSVLGLEQFNHAEKQMLERFFAAHSFWISRYPSLHSSANNHRIAELAGLIAATTAAPGIKNAEVLKRQALKDLTYEIERQILPDGVGAEQSLAYSAFAIELCLLSFYVLGLQPPDLPDAIRHRLCAWADHARWMMDSTGRVPAIGDCDESRVVSMSQEVEPRYVASIAAAVAGYFQRLDLAPPHADPHLRDNLFKSVTKNSDNPIGVRTWQDGGYTVVRSRPAEPIVLVLDHGPLGYLSIAAHGHADTLAIWLAIGGRPVFVDAGTFLYGGDPEMRERLRGTALHNTLTISDNSSSLSAGLFNWSKKANGRLLHLAKDLPVEIVAEHDGYLDRYSVRHRRTIGVTDAASISITDELIGATLDEEVAISFLLDPSCSARIDPDKETDVIVRDENGEILRFSGGGPLAPHVVRGDGSARLGWQALNFGVRVPTYQILFRGQLSRPSTIRLEIFR
jgi:hypothetical protein